MDVCILMSSCFCSASWACDSIRPAPLALGTVRTDHATKLNQTKKSGPTRRLVLSAQMKDDTVSVASQCARDWMDHYWREPRGSVCRFRRNPTLHHHRTYNAVQYSTAAAPDRLFDRFQWLLGVPVMRRVGREPRLQKKETSWRRCGRVVEFETSGQGGSPNRKSRQRAFFPALLVQYSTQPMHMSCWLVWAGLGDKNQLINQPNITVRNLLL